MPLSNRQREAAHRRGQDVCVLAGPGSGKTSVLIERFSWLVQQQGISPRRILAITFTEKAAIEIRERMLRAFENAPAMRHEIERAWVSTIHAFCARLLRENAIAAGIDPGFTVLEQAEVTLYAVADEALETLFEEDPGTMRRFLRSLAVATERDGYVPDLASSLIDIYQAVRLAGASFDDLRRAPASRSDLVERLRRVAQNIESDRPKINTPNQRDEHGKVDDWLRSFRALPQATVSEEHIRLLCRDNPNKGRLVMGSAARTQEEELRGLCKDLLAATLREYYASDLEMIAGALERIDERYRKQKRNSSLLDFDDLEEAAIRLLEGNAALRERVRSSFDYILMDELQDTNPLQWRLMELVRRPGSFFAVGDVNQSIYGFRHARPELFEAYRRGLEHGGHTVDELRDNYRSRPELLESINRLFAGAPGVELHSLVAGVEFPKKTTESVELLTVYGSGGPEVERIEALWVARRIVELVGNLHLADGPAQYGDIAILTRANYSTADLQLALDEFGIPSVVVGGITFYETREVRDLGLLLEVLVNPRNEVALAGLLRSPLIGLTDEDLLRLTQHGSLERGVQVEQPPGWSTILDLRRLRNQISPDRLLRRAMDECDYESGLTDRGRANVTKFLAMVRERYEKNPVPLAKLVDDVGQLSPEAEAPPSATGDAVRLMTIHKAKGLEFPVVFLPFLHKGRSYDFPVVSYSARAGLGVKWRNPVTGDGVGDQVWQENKRSADLAQQSEENRLLYVGCTRAKEHLVLSWSQTGSERGSWHKLVGSRLASDVPADLTSADLVSGGARIFRTDRAPLMAGAAARASAVHDAPVTGKPATPGCADSSASVTDVAQFSECPRKYYLSRYLNGSQQAPGRLNSSGSAGFLSEERAIDAGQLGTQVHALLAGESISDTDPEAVYLAKKFEASDLFRLSRQATRREREWDFVFNHAGLVLRGQIDLWFESREIFIVDYKTDRKPHGVKIQSYDLQLQLYALALGQALGRRPDRAILFMLRTSDAVEVDLSPLALGSASEAVHRFRDSQAATHFPLCAGDHCFNCEFFDGLCPANALTVAKEAQVSGIFRNNYRRK